MLINERGGAARAWLLGMLLCLVTAGAFAHGVSESDQSFLQGATGVHFLPYLYLGAKHMVTGYDHLLFLCGVIFFLYRMKDIGVYVTLFALGHSTTLLLGVLNGWHINAYLVDAIIGLSIVYRAFDNLGGFKTVFGFQPNKKAAVLIFGFFHGLGLATKLQDFSLSPDGLVPNMIAFNLGVELGQLLALGMILIVVRYWRTSASFARHALTSNFALMGAGFVLAGLQFTGYISQ
ncbi:HupE/UreJ family protein [Massilia pseudoviolaceinigra]|uniref:HupE/UreJ family protein n=1 Tax=Massilia pseudoviolaceinigra TaxID=3057165 RepID=UPI0027967A88|nr:HupE/UreJ family protein [Massilia sp. CCM 9206]MDQ1924024.1 HupE/UreJ family protein [Massilia sp. CCM 9206]